jgi:hypothetical protein
MKVQVAHKQGVLLCEVGDVPFELAKDYGFHLGIMTQREAWPYEFACSSGTVILRMVKFCACALAGGGNGASA